MKKLQLLILTLCFFSYSYADLNPKLSVTVDGNYDSNIPQNITEYGLFYVNPSAYFSLKPSFANMKIALSINYENYIEQRSAYLNSPFHKASLYYYFRGETYKITPFYSYVLYVHPSFDIAKVSHILGSKFDYDINNKNNINAGVKYYVNDYGDNSYDAHRLNMDVGYTRTFRVTKKSILAIRKAGLSYGFERNMADTSSSIYSRHEVALSSKFKVSSFNLTLKAAYANKAFDEKEVVNYQAEAAQRVNDYYNFYYKIESPSFFSDKVDLQFDGSFRLKNSTNPIYKYVRNTVRLSLNYSLIKRSN